MASISKIMIHHKIFVSVLGTSNSFYHQVVCAVLINCLDLIDSDQELNDAHDLKKFNPMLNQEEDQRLDAVIAKVFRPIRIFLQLYVVSSFFHIFWFIFLFLISLTFFIGARRFVYRTLWFFQRLSPGPISTSPSSAISMWISQYSSKNSTTARSCTLQVSHTTLSSMRKTSSKFSKAEGLNKLIFRRDPS